MEERCGGIRSGHEVFADKKTIKTGMAQLEKVGLGVQTGFSYGEAIVGNVLDQFERSLHADSKSFQVAVVDAYDPSVGQERVVEFSAGVNFDQGLHLEFAAKGNQVAQQRIAERRDNQQKAVGVVGSCFPHLPAIKDEIFAERGQRHFLAGVPQILKGAAKKLPFR